MPDSPARVKAAQEWASNAALIADCAALGYLRREWKTLDPTYGEGNWWKAWRPAELEENVWDPKNESGWDFREIPWEPESFDAVVFDPPYVAPGGRETSSIKSFHEKYGMGETPPTPALLHLYNLAGLAECHRVLRPARRRNGPEGMCLVKCQDYIWSGTFQPATFWMMEAAATLGFEVIDRLEHIGDLRAQPLMQSRCDQCDAKFLKGRETCAKCGATGRKMVPIRQVHARRNLSTMLVLRRSRHGDRVAALERAAHLLEDAVERTFKMAQPVQDVLPSEVFL